MIIYEVCFKDHECLYELDEYAYFSNKVKAKSFVAKNKKSITKVHLLKKQIKGDKTSVIRLLNSGVAVKYQIGGLYES